jgi:hypothetical protein
MIACKRNIATNMAPLHPGIIGIWCFSDALMLNLGTPFYPKNLRFPCSYLSSSKSIRYKKSAFNGISKNTPNCSPQNIHNQSFNRLGKAAQGKKIRKFFTLDFIQIRGKSSKNAHKNTSKTPLKPCKL